MFTTLQEGNLLAKKKGFGFKAESFKRKCGDKHTKHAPVKKLNGNYPQFSHFNNLYSKDVHNQETEKKAAKKTKKPEPWKKLRRTPQTGNRSDTDTRAILIIFSTNYF